MQPAGIPLAQIETSDFTQITEENIGVRSEEMCSPNIPIFVRRGRRSGPHCETRIIKGFSQSISRRNFLRPGCGPMGFKTRLWGAKVTDRWDVFRKWRHTASACNEYHRRQGKHNTSLSTSIPLSRRHVLEQLPGAEHWGLSPSESVSVAAVCRLILTGDMLGPTQNKHWCVHMHTHARMCTLTYTHKRSHTRTDART